MFVTCLHCKTQFEKSKYQIKRSPNNYCSRSCSAKETNKTPKRTKTKKCENCKELILSRATYCKDCFGNKQKLDDRPISDLIYANHHKSSAFALIRGQARTIAKQQGWTSCHHCGYDKHIEIAHKKAIKDFPVDTTVNVVNHVENLIPLCRNCHWELDH
tara:strand:- start:171 stop:647 length:477 start_codon:yes stop_codon:yes gene_type:complete